jgi:hypothetical protein
MVTLCTTHEFFLSVGGYGWYMVWNLCFAITINSVLANSKTQNAFLFPVHAVFCHNCPLAVKPVRTPQCLLHKKIWRDILPIDMLLSAVCLGCCTAPSLWSGKLGSKRKHINQTNKSITFLRCTHTYACDVCNKAWEYRCNPRTCYTHRRCMVVIFRICIEAFWHTQPSFTDICQKFSL